MAKLLTQVYDLGSLLKETGHEGESPRQTTQHT